MKRAFFAAIIFLVLAGIAHAGNLATWDGVTLPSGGGGTFLSFSGDGALLTNNGSVGAVRATLGTAGAYTFWGNNTNSTSTPGYYAIPAAAISGLTNSNLSGSAAISNANLANPAISIAGTSASLGGTITLDTITGLSSTGIVKRTGTNALGIASATDLPVMGASGTGHAPGAVGDPGASAGSTRYWREDATWQVPSMSSGTAVYSMPAGCGGGITTSTTCKSLFCSTAGGTADQWMNCSGSCNQNTTATCSTTAAGHLAP